MLKDSKYQSICNAAPPILTCHLVAASKLTWRKASTSERRKMVVEEVRHQEEAERSAKAVSLAKRGQWMRWEGLERRRLTWTQLCEMEASNISFIIIATYDVLPSPKNLRVVWYGENPTCALCPTPATLKHFWPPAYQPHTRPLHLEAQPGPQESGSSYWEQEEYQQLIASESNQLHHNTHFHPRGTEKAKPSQYQVRNWSASHTPGLEDASWYRPTTNLSTWDCSYHSQARLDTLVPLAEVSQHHWTHSPVGEFDRRGLWAQEIALHRTGSRRATLRMEGQSLSSWSGMQRLCGLFYHQTPERPWYPRTGSSTGN